jgi:hypothetical protein
MPRKRKRSSRLAVSSALHASHSLWNPRIPVRWLNFVVALFLLPLAAVWSQTFFSAFSHATNRGFWATQEFWFFSLGALLWTIAFFGLPKPVLLYVFGHELTHAIWAWMMGARVRKFHVHRDGGYIVTDKRNIWIALAPYFFPLYSIFVILVWAAASWFVDFSVNRSLLFGLIGGTWAFHVSFTLWAIPRGQTDLTYYGTFFSLVIIYMMNLLVLTLFLLGATPHVTLESFSRELFDNAAALATWIAQVAGW